MAKKQTAEMQELAMDQLDEVVGGWSIGVYGSVSAINPVGNVGTGTAGGPASTGGYTVAVGLQSSFPYVTGGIYQTTGTGISTGASVGVSGGGFVSTSNADGVFTGSSTQFGLGVDALGKVGAESSGNSSGVTGGVGVGLGVGVEGVQASGFQTNTTSVFDGHDNQVDTHSPTIDQPVYDAMGNATGYTQSVPNPNYDGHANDPGAGDNHANDPGADLHASDPGTDTHANDPGTDTHANDPGTDTHANDPTADHSTDQPQQGGFDNNNGEGGSDYGGGSDFA